MSLVTATERSRSLAAFRPDMSGVLSDFQASVAMTRAEGQELVTTFTNYQDQTEANIASKIQKLQLALNEALRREESAALSHTKTVETLEARIASSESTLDATRKQMIAEAQKAKEQMAELTKSHATALQTALAACRSQANAAQAAAVAAERTRAQNRLNEAAQAVAALESGLQNDIGWYTTNPGSSAFHFWTGLKQAQYTKDKIPPILQKIRAHL